MVHGFLHQLRLVDVQIAAFWPSEEPAKVADGITLCRCVDNREHFLEMLRDELEIPISSTPA